MRDHKRWMQGILVSWLWPSLAYADDAADRTGGFLGTVPFILMFGVIYFLMMRPAQKQRQEREQEQEDMLNALRRDDEVVTQSGLIGRLVSVEDKIVTIELGDRVRVRMLRERVAGLWDSKTNSGNAAANPSRKQAAS